MTLVQFDLYAKVGSNSRNVLMTSSSMNLLFTLKSQNSLGSNLSKKLENSSITILTFDEEKIIFDWGSVTYIKVQNLAPVCCICNKTFALVFN